MSIVGALPQLCQQRLAVPFPFPFSFYTVSEKKLAA